MSAHESYTAERARLEEQKWARARRKLAWGWMAAWGWVALVCWWLAHSAQ